MPRFRLSRRSLLRGTAGFAMALPALEIMSGTARAGVDIPKRYFYGFAGTSTSFPNFDYDLLKPDTIGTGYDIKRALQPIADLGVRDEVSVVTDLLIPWGEEGSIPAGGRHIGWHAHSTAPLISGVRSINGSNEAANGPTSEVIAADYLGGDETLHRFLTYRVQAAYYRGSNGDGGNRGRISYREEGGSIIPIDPVSSRVWRTSRCSPASCRPTPPRPPRPWPRSGAVGQPSTSCSRMPSR
jgi:hypothetical protein